MSASLLQLHQQSPRSFILSGDGAESRAGGQAAAKENARDLVQYGHQYLLLPGLHLLCLMGYGYGHWSRLPARGGRTAVQWVKTSLAGGSAIMFLSICL